MAIFEHDFDFSIRNINKNTELTNKAILGFFEDIGGYQSDIAGYGLKDIEKTRLSWVLLHWKVKVLKRIKYGDELHVKTWSRGAVRACCYRDYEIYNKEGELCVIATSRWALIHLEKGLMRLTDELVDKYQTENKAVFEDFHFDKLKEPENSNLALEYTVQRRDIDINNHMHNLCYLDLAYEALPKEIYENTSFDNIEIMYKTGSKLYDNLKCFYSKIENEHFVTIKSEDEKILHAIIKLS
jgi:medium-chain acyl-[acyl-carrier-protein] hydrolase